MRLPGSGGRKGARPSAPCLTTQNGKARHTPSTTRTSAIVSDAPETLAGAIVAGQFPGQHKSVFLEGKRGLPGVLMVHGFTATPSEHYALGKFLNEKGGLTVSIPLLPGHGESPAALNTVGRDEWQGSVISAEANLRLRCSEVFGIGLSMGSMLTFQLELLLAMSGQKQLSGIVSLSTIFWLRSKGFHWFLNFLDKSLLWDIFGRREYPKTRDKEVMPERFAYDVYPGRALRSFLHLVNDTKKIIPQIRCPVFMVHSKTDTVAPIESVAAMAKALPYKPKTLILDDFDHVLTCDPRREEIFEPILNFILHSSQGVTS